MIFFGECNGGSRELGACERGVIVGHSGTTGASDKCGSRFHLRQQYLFREPLKGRESCALEDCLRS